MDQLVTHNLATQLVKKGTFLWSIVYKHTLSFRPTLQTDHIYRMAMICSIIWAPPVATPIDTPILKGAKWIIAVEGICCVKLCTNKIEALTHSISKFSKFLWLFALWNRPQILPCLGVLHTLRHCNVEASDHRWRSIPNECHYWYSRKLPHSLNYKYFHRQSRCSQPANVPTTKWFDTGQAHRYCCAHSLIA
jgi:hypothetical protein